MIRASKNSSPRPRRRRRANKTCGDSADLVENRFRKGFRREKPLKLVARLAWPIPEHCLPAFVAKTGWRGVDLQPHLDAVTQVENVAVTCLKKGDWVLDHVEGELAFMRGADFRQ